MTDPNPLIALEQVTRIYSKGQCIALNELPCRLKPLYHGPEAGEIYPAAHSLWS